MRGGLKASRPNKKYEREGGLGWSEGGREVTLRGHREREGEGGEDRERGIKREGETEGD